jgi:hypothetical protein
MKATGSRIIVWFAAACCAAELSAQTTAFQAMKKLPEGKAATVARIIGVEGTPQPDRWHFIVSEPAEPSGFTEYVIAHGEIVASRSLSQFADRIAPTDVLGATNLRFDSDKAAALVQDYAFANNALITRIDYRLTKEGADASPVWQLTVYDDTGKKVGTIDLTASKGAVVGNEGFAVAPKTAATQKEGPTGFETFVDSEIASPPPSESPRKTARRSRRSDDDDDEHSGPSRVFRKVGGSFQKFFTGRDTISR